MEGFITGVGWVSARSMGNRHHCRTFASNAGLPVISRKTVLEQPYKPFGRMDDFSKTGFTAIAFALADAGIKQDTAKKEIGLVASTGTGCMETDLRYWKTMAEGVPSPAVFAYTLDSCFLGEAAICFGLAGELFVINEKNTSGMTGLFLALEQLHSGGPEAILCGVCNSDLRCSDTIERNIPGAVFFVIEKKGGAKGIRIAAASPEQIYIETKHTITDLHVLAEKCCRDDRYIW